MIFAVCGSIGVTWPLMGFIVLSGWTEPDRDVWHQAPLRQLAMARGVGCWGASWEFPWEPAEERARTDAPRFDRDRRLLGPCRAGRAGSAVPPLPEDPALPRVGSAALSAALCGRRGCQRGAPEGGRSAARGCLGPAGPWAVAMGVPKFYRWISERYPCLSQVLKEHQVSRERGAAACQGPFSAEQGGPERPLGGARDRAWARPGWQGWAGAGARSQRHGAARSGRKWRDGGVRPLGSRRSFRSPFKSLSLRPEAAGSALQFPGSAGPERFLSRGRPGPPAGLAPFASVSPAVLPQKARGAPPAPGGPSPARGPVGRSSRCLGSVTGHSNGEGQVLQLCCVSLLLRVSECVLVATLKSMLKLEKVKLQIVLLAVR